MTSPVDACADSRLPIVIAASTRRSIAPATIRSSSAPSSIATATFRRRVVKNNSTWIQGGPRMRVYNRDTPWLAPALNKAPVVWWKKHFTYQSSTHDLVPIRLNWAHTPGEVSLTGCLFHFKFVATLMEKAKEEAERKQHYAGGREFTRYRVAGSVSLLQRGDQRAVRITRATDPSRLDDAADIGSEQNRSGLSAALTMPRARGPDDSRAPCRAPRWRWLARPRAFRTWRAPPPGAWRRNRRGSRRTTRRRRYGAHCLG